MALPKWQRSGGREFAFYHSHSGFEWESLEITNKYQEMLCNDFQVDSVCVSLAKFARMQLHMHLAQVSKEALEAVML